MRISLACVALFAIAPLCSAAGSELSPQTLHRAPGRVVPVAPVPGGAKRIRLTRQWTGELCRSKVINFGKEPIRVKEVILFSIAHQLPPETSLYAESFQMLSQTAGTLAKPVDLGYSELKHYRLPQPAGAFAASGMLSLTPPNGNAMVLAFTSCRRFIGRFYLRTHSIDVAVDTEGLELAPGEAWDLEEFMFATGGRRPDLLARLASRINLNHPPLRFPKPPTGWCSWYCFGPRVTAQQVLDNLDAIAKNIPGLKYVQIDDGYQPAMGDWLETGKAFGGDLLGVLKQIRNRGFEPAIWVAPFIAEPNSHLFQQHPGWFMKGEDGKPLPSNQVTFGGCSWAPRVTVVTRSATTPPRTRRMNHPPGGRC